MKIDNKIIKIGEKKFQNNFYDATKFYFQINSPFSHLEKKNREIQAVMPAKM